MSSSARKPRGPTAMLVGIPREAYRWGCLSDFPDFLSYALVIRGWGKIGVEAEPVDPQAPNLLFLFSLGGYSHRIFPPSFG